MVSSPKWESGLLSRASRTKSLESRHQAPSWACTPARCWQWPLVMRRSERSSSRRSRSAGTLRQSVSRRSSLWYVPTLHRTSGCTGFRRGCRPRTFVSARTGRPRRTPSLGRNSPCNSPHGNLRPKRLGWATEPAPLSQAGRPIIGRVKRFLVLQERILQTSSCSLDREWSALSAVSPPARSTVSRWGHTVKGPSKRATALVASS